MSVTKTEYAAMCALLDRVNHDNPSSTDIAALRQGFKEHPSLWKMAGDLAAQAQLHILEHVRGTPAMKESTKEALRVLGRELGQGEPPMLEQLVIDQILFCWLRYYLTDYDYTTRRAEGLTPKQVDYWERRLTQTQKRYLRAIEALARVRRLAHVTPLQVNIGAQQVNVAGGVSVPAGARNVE